MKLKTRKAANKRIKKKKRMLYRRKAYKNHLLGHKNSKRLRKLSKVSVIKTADKKQFLRMINLFN